METVPVITGIMLSLTGLLYFSLIGFFTYGWYLSKGDRKTKTTSPGIKISVIVAARNEEKNIDDLLGDLKIQDYPSALLEIIVVDDHSTDNTAKIVSDFITKNKLSGFVLIQNEDFKAAGKKAAIKHGVTRSAGDLILTTDADCRVGSGWVSSMAAYFEDEKKVMVFGPVSYYPGKGMLNRFQSLEFYGLTASGAGAAGAGHPFLCNGANLAYRRNAFMEVKGFEGNERFISGDDVFLMHKMKKEFGSHAICFSRDERSMVRTYPAPGLLTFFKQRIRWASKTMGYKDFLSLTTALVVFAYNFILAGTFIAGFFCPVLFLLFAAFIIVKSLTDLPLMWGVTGLTGSRQLMKWYLPFQVFYPFYVVLAGILSFFGRRRW